jgi:hypothetical protein
LIFSSLCDRLVRKICGGVAHWQETSCPSCGAT